MVIYTTSEASSPEKEEENSEEEAILRRKVLESIVENLEKGEKEKNTKRQEEEEEEEERDMFEIESDTDKTKDTDTVNVAKIVERQPKVFIKKNVIPPMGSLRQRTREANNDSDDEGNNEAGKKSKGKESGDADSTDTDTDSDFEEDKQPPPPKNKSKTSKNSPPLTVTPPPVNSPKIPSEGRLKQTSILRTMSGASTIRRSSTSTSNISQLAGTSTGTQRTPGIIGSQTDKDKDDKAEDLCSKKSQKTKSTGKQKQLGAKRIYPNKAALSKAEQKFEHEQFCKKYSYLKDFAVVNSIDRYANTLFFKCLACQPKNKILKCNVLSVYNLKKHMEKVHPGKVYREYVTASSVKDKQTDEIETDSEDKSDLDAKKTDDSGSELEEPEEAYEKAMKVKETETIKKKGKDNKSNKKTTIVESKPKVKKIPHLTQMRTTNAVVEFFVSNFISLRVVETPSFIKMLRTMNPGYKGMSRRTLMRKTGERYTRMFKKLTR